MSEQNDPNFGFVGGKNGFEEWACDDFNLLEYVGADGSPFADLHKDNEEYDINDEDESMRKKDIIYSTLQYNNALLPNDSLHQMHSEQIDGYGDPPNFYDHGQVPNYSIDHSYKPQLNDPSMPSTSKNISSIKRIKIEPTNENTFEEFGNHSEYGEGHSIHSESEDYTRTRPRKYRIKPDTEKRNPQYRAKREKNNDAVRRSRDKAKRLQEQKEDRLTFLEKDDARKSQIIKHLQSRANLLEKELIRYKNNCTCLIPQP